MKLQELAVANPTKQAAKVFESYFGKTVNFDSLNGRHARSMLNRVRALVAEHRRQPEFHRSEQNPAYLKLVMMEQALAQRVKEAEETDAQIKARIQKIQDPKLKAAMMKSQSGQTLTPDEQKMVAGAAMSKTNAQPLSESEVQQAQVVLASQDMVDEVQDMLEKVTAMQYKDLPALVDSIKNQVGVDQATQFNTDATAALTGLVQNLQGAKQQLETALGVVTGQAPTVPGADMGADLGADLGAEPAPAETDIDVDADIDIDDEEGPGATTLGRERR